MLSIAIGANVQASGPQSIAIGQQNIASGAVSLAFGAGLTANQNNQTVIGKYNSTINTSNCLFIIGNGSSTSSVSNAMTVDIGGNVTATTFTGALNGTAARAISDEDGNNIKLNYASSISISGNTIILKNKNGTNLGDSITIPTTDISGKKNIQSAVSDPTASGNGLTFISTITQNTQGVITATKKTVQSASANQSGVVDTGEQTFAGNKTFSGTNTTIGRNIIRTNNSAPGQGDTTLSALGFKTGYPLFTDPTFLSGLNGIVYYNNVSGGNVVIIRDTYSNFGINSPGTESNYVIQIKNTGSAGPGCGGFFQSFQSRANAQFIQIFRALIPVGRNVQRASNPAGDYFQDEWLTSQAGTGKWEWYARRLICGQDGGLSTSGHVYIDGAVGSSSSPVVWYVAFCNVYDVTRADYDGLRTRYADSIAWSGITNKPTTLSGYGITDAKINNGTITLGGNTITPLTSHQDITGKANLVSPAFTGSPTAPTPSSTSSTTAIATKGYVDSAFAANDAMIFKGGLNGSATSPGNYTPLAQCGWTYKVATAGYINGVKMEVGDMLVCTVDTAAATSSNYTTINNKWLFIESNNDGYVIGPASSTANNIAVFSGTTGKVIKDSGFTIAKSVPSDAKFTDTTYSAGTGLSLSGTTFNHSNSTIATTTQAIYPIKIDAQGHISGYGTAVTPLTASSTLDATKLSGTIPTSCYTNTTYSSLTAASGGTAVSLVTTGEKYTWNNNYVKKSGDTMTGQLVLSSSGLKTSNTGGYSTDGNGNFHHLRNAPGDYWNIQNSTNNVKFLVYYDSGNVEAKGTITGTKVYGAVWNDYAEYRKDNPEEKEIQKPGRCVREVGDGTLALTTGRLQRGCEIISDTFGFAIGQSDGYNTPIASSGRVLAYLYEDRELARDFIGWPVCSGPDGTVSIMTEEEENRYSNRIVGTISEIPDYEEWGTGKVKVDGRIWIRIK